MKPPKPNRFSEASSWTQRETAASIRENNSTTVVDLIEVEEDDKIWRSTLFLVNKFLNSYINHKFFAPTWAAAIRPKSSPCSGLTIKFWSASSVSIFPWTKYLLILCLKTYLAFSIKIFRFRTPPPNITSSTLVVKKMLEHIVPRYPPTISQTSWSSGKAGMSFTLDKPSLSLIDMFVQRPSTQSPWKGQTPLKSLSLLSRGTKTWPPSGWRVPWTHLPLMINPIPTPVPTVT